MTHKDKSNEELILEYKKTKDIKLKQEIVLKCSYIVKTIAKQMRGVYVGFAELDDIVNEGIITLMSALDKFDPSKNVKFETYASFRVRGSIIDLARKQDWFPRSHKKTAKLIDSAEACLFDKLGRHPSDEEIAEYLGVGLDKYLKMLSDTNLHNVLSFDALIDNSEENSNYINLTDPDLESNPEYVAQRNETAEILEAEIVKLRENEQLVLSLYYRKNLNMREIAEVLGVKEPRISQIHANAIRKLRITLEKKRAELV